MSEYKLNPKHNSLVLYYDIKPMLEILTDDEAGQLFRLVMNMDEDINPEDLGSTGDPALSRR